MVMPSALFKAVATTPADSRLTKTGSQSGMLALIESTVIALQAFSRTSIFGFNVGNLRKLVEERRYTINRVITFTIDYTAKRAIEYPD